MGQMEVSGGSRISPRLGCQPSGGRQHTILSNLNRRPIEHWCESLMYTFDELAAEWERIASFYRLPYSPLVKDFHLLFINRAFQLNNVVVKYCPSVSSNCSFCHN